MAGEFATADDYIGSFPADVQVVLEEVRQTIRNAVPAPGETISYQTPKITVDGTDLVYFAAWKNHIGMSPPIPTTDESLEQEVAPYRGPKGNFRFPLEEPLPSDLISRLATVLVNQRLNGEQ